MNFKQRAEEITTIWIDGVKCECHPHRKDIESALRSAYQEGLEDAANVAEEHDDANNVNTSFWITTKIRQLKEQV